MRAKVIAASAILGAVAFFGGGAVPAATATAPDPYSGSIKTTCNVSVPGNVKPGERVVIKISVRANSPSKPTGTINLAITGDSGGQVWSKTVDYDGGNQRVVGPELPKGDNYRVSMRFQPGDDTFARCNASAKFDVGAAGGGGGGGDGDGDDDGAGGLLPDTGGPALLWLLLGVGLVGGGTATVVYSRRRTAAAASV